MHTQVLQAFMECCHSHFEAPVGWGLTPSCQENPYLCLGESSPLAPATQPIRDQEVEPPLGWAEREVLLQLFQVRWPWAIPSIF